MRSNQHCNPALKHVLAQTGGISQFAEQVGIPQRTAYYRVRKCGCLSFDQAKRVAAIFDVSVSGLQEPPK
jgi:DNA-binding phage protein